MFQVILNRSRRKKFSKNFRKIPSPGPRPPGRDAASRSTALGAPRFAVASTTTLSNTFKLHHVQSCAIVGERHFGENAQLQKTPKSLDRPATSRRRAASSFPGAPYRAEWSNIPEGSEAPTLFLREIIDRTHRQTYILKFGPHVGRQFV